MYKSVALLNSPRKGGPLKWSNELEKYIRLDSSYNPKLITSPVRLALFHIHNSFNIVHSAVPITYSLWKKPYLLTVKGDYTIEKSIWHKLYKIAIKKADLVTVPSQYLKDRVPELSEAIVIPNAVDLLRFKQVKLFEREKISFLIVSNFLFPLKSKGVITLINLLKKFNSSNPNINIKLTIVGQGKYISEVKTASKGCNFEIIFTGWDDPCKYYENSDVFLYYSYHDNMPNSVLEAMSVGLPVISNIVGALPEMISNEQDGFLAKDEEEYLKYISIVVNNFNHRKKIGESARNTIESKFDWKQIIKQFIYIYNKISN